MIDVCLVWMLMFAVVLLSLSDATAALATDVVSFSAPGKNRQCVVVGGGPVGLATAITLSRPPHSYTVTVLEKSEGAESVTAYDPTRSYLYNVNPRGLRWFTTAPTSAFAMLKERGAAPKDGMGQICRVPADPDAPIEPPKEVSISGTVALKNSTNFWIPRHQMVNLLLECCFEQNKGERGKVIEVLAGKQVDSVVPQENDELTVHCTDGCSYTVSLVVAADGIDSSIRTCLADESQDTWLQSDAQSFRVKKFKSPSTGIKLKALQFPPGFTLRNSDGSVLETRSTTIYAIRGKYKGSRNYLSLGMLPMKDPDLVRPANTNTLHDHEIWSLTTGTQAKEWFQKCFPRLPWDDLVNDAEWERYVRAKGTVFPYCQYSPGSAVSSPDGSTGVVMVGDACHAFPPDIGQGINAGLEDVVALDRALKGQDIKTGSDDVVDRPYHLGEALWNYQRNRRMEHRALIRLARFGAPYQYKQPWKRHRIGNFFWTLNVVFRLLLNKVSFGLIPPTCVVLMTQNHNLTFRQVMRRADTTALVLKVLSAALVLKVAKLVIKKFALGV